MPLFRNKKKLPYPYDSETEEPVFHVSICTGETAFGFRDKESGHFREAILIADDHEKELLQNAYGPEALKKIY